MMISKGCNQKKKEITKLESQKIIDKSKINNIQ